VSFTTVVRHCDEDAQPVLCIVPCIKYVLTFSRSFCHRCDSQVALAVVKIKPSTGLLLRSSILPQALNLAASPLLQDLALDSLLELFEAMIIADIVSVQEMRAAALDRLPKGNDALASKSAIVNLAKCIAVTTCAAAESVRTETVSTLIQSLEGMDSNILLLQLSLLTSGEIGQRLDLNQLSGSVAVQLRTLYIRYLDDSNEEIRTAAAYALGRAAVGSKEVFLPPIIEAFESSSQKKQYLLLSSLQEVVKCHQKNHQDLSTSVSVIVPHLVQHFSAKEEGVRKMVADCIGSLCCLQPKEILPLLETLTVAHAGKHVKADADSDVASEDSLICWTIATSVKNAVSNKVPVLEMQPAMPTFLTLLQEEDLSAKLAALIMVYATVHHMPELLTTLMKDRILPSLQEVSSVWFKYFHFRISFVSSLIYFFVYTLFDAAITGCPIKPEENC
jgi:cullin-associated NEDD8-dissociated protein 1